ncbi:MAG: hypothetical protein HY247_03620 [archaeon]|nr:MAG: hypothetical protein HY247_03620 [archaeon]
MSLNERNSAIIVILLGLTVFALGALALSIWALLGIAIASASATVFTFRAFGRRVLLAALVSSVFGAMVAWIAMRTMMRLVAVSSGISLTLTAGGTLAILGTALLMGILPGVGLVHFRARFGTSIWTSIAYGWVLSILGGVPMALLLSAEIIRIASDPAIPVAFLLEVPILFALTVDLSLRGLGRWTRLGAPSFRG